MINTYVESRKRQFDEERGRQFLGGESSMIVGSSFSSQQQQQGRFEECWLCGSCEHRRRDCPNRFTQLGDGGDGTQQVFQRRVQCLGCRKIGHLVKDCPVRAGSALATSLSTDVSRSKKGDEDEERGGGGSTRCYNCGGAHRLKECTEPKVGGGTSYATCFVCQQTGHIARSCPKNTHGIYVSGGSCKRCGSVEHLVSECSVPREDSSSALSNAVVIKPDVKKRKSIIVLGDDLEGNLDGGRVDNFDDREEEESTSRSKKIKSKKIRNL